MKLAEIQCCGTGSKRLNGQKKNVSFQATPEQIIKIANKNFVGWRRQFLLDTADSFQDIQNKIKFSNNQALEYKLGVKNPIPKNLSRIGKYIWNGVDRILNTERSFGPEMDSRTSNNGEKQNLGLLLKRLLTSANAENPDKITMATPEKKSLFF